MPHKWTSVGDWFWATSVERQPSHLTSLSLTLSHFTHPQSTCKICVSVVYPTSHLPVHVTHTLLCTQHGLLTSKERTDNKLRYTAFQSHEVASLDDVNWTQIIFACDLTSLYALTVLRQANPSLTRLSCSLPYKRLHNWRLAGFYPLFLLFSS